VKKTMTRLSELCSKFQDLYGEESTIYRAPGRVNLIGEHTDYNDGFVLPAAIDLFTWVAISPRDDRRILVRSENLAKSAELDLESLPRLAGREWSNYVFGVATVLEQSGHRLSGANLLIRSEVPIGAGVSSSAALEVAAGFSLLANSGIAIEGRKLALACQRAENEFVGIRSGIMDQLASACCAKDHALLLDCRTLDFTNIPLPPGTKLVICNTMVKRELAASAYNTRREECEEGVRILATRYPGIHALRDITLRQLQKCESALPPVVYKRCRHVISENDRVMQAAKALAQKRIDELGDLMAESHRSLREDYEVSSAELDLLVELANQADGVRGARMTGAGFGGCTVNLVSADAVADFGRRVSVGYQTRTGIKPDIYICSAADGVRQAE
jgi:galactokinase